MSGLGPALLATLVGIVSAALSLWIADVRLHARVFIALSGGMLLGLTAFALLPETVAETGAAVTVALLGAGYLLLLAISRFVSPVCPTCSHDHDHASCATALHGFAAPLVCATALHALLDGWSIGAAQNVSFAVPLAIALHKIPEGAALGAMLGMAMRRPLYALAWSAAAEGATAAGAALSLAFTPALGGRWIHYPLGIAAGVFLYLGTHAIHGEWKRRGALPAFFPAATGAAGVAALQKGVQALFR